jgi:probable HAF family extracellular repeat protein
MIDLGSLRTDNLGYSDARAVSADGDVVVGLSDTDDENDRAFRWDTASADMLDLGSLRTDNLGYSIALAVSADGSVVVGNAQADDGSGRAFIWRTQMQDFTNLMLSFPTLANDTEIAVAQQQAVVERLMDQTCFAEAGQACMSVGGWLANSGSTASQDIGSHSSSVGTLSYGRGINGQTTLGGTLSLSNTNLSSNGFDMGNAISASLWAEYSEGGLSRTGWQAGAAIGYGRESGDITRGRGLDNIMLATGEADLTTTAARATLGYGFQQKDWLIAPSLTLAHYSTERSAYAETGSDFNASYDELSMQRTTATLAVSGERKVSEQGALSLGAGLEHDLSADRVTLTGASTVPGMEDFAVNSTLERRDTRGFFHIGYTHDLGNGRNLSGSARIGQAAFGSEPQVSLGINYAIRF